MFHHLRYGTILVTRPTSVLFQRHLQGVSSVVRDGAENVQFSSVQKLCPMCKVLPESHTALNCWLKMLNHRVRSVLTALQEEIRTSLSWQLFLATARPQAEL